MNDNLNLWLSVEKTNTSQTKAVRSGGRQITAIDAYSQLKKATELWGPYGSAWKLDNITHEELPAFANGTILVKTSGTFCYPGGCFPGFSSGELCYKTKPKVGEGYIKIDSEIYKKNETDLITKCLSRLGFNADVFLGKFDDNKYVQGLKREEAAAAKAAAPKPPTVKDENIPALIAHALKNDISLQGLKKIRTLTDTQIKTVSDALGEL